MNSLIVLTEVSLLLYTFIYIPALCYNATTFYSIFTAHPILMALSFALSAYGIKSFKLGNTAPDLKNTKASVEQFKIKADIHGAFMFVSFVFVLIAFSAVEYVKISNNYSHFKSWHGTLGFATSLVFLSQGLFGFLMKNFPSLMLGVVKKLGLSYKQGWYAHKTNGYVLFTLMYLILMLGFGTSWMQTQANLYGNKEVKLLKLNFADLFWYCGAALQTIIWATISLKSFVTSQ